LTSTNGMGNNNKLPWHPKRLLLDMQFLKMVTTSRYNIKEEDFEFTKTNEIQNIVIMGRQTWDSIPQKFKPMSGRINIIITRNKDKFCNDNINIISNDNGNVLVATSFEEALHLASSVSDGQIFILGGSSIYAEALVHSDCEAIFMTRLLDGHFDMPCDVTFPIHCMPPNIKEINITKLSFNLLKHLCPKVLLLEGDNRGGEDVVVVVEGRNSFDTSCENEIKYNIKLLLPNA